jgi:DNA-binding NarL/FixJ family response regulator
MDDRLLLARVRRQYGCDLRFTSSPEVGLTLASQTHYDLIFCDRNQPGYPWREVMEGLVARSPRSCVLLVSDISDDLLWRDVLQLGGYGVLVRPLRDAAILQAVESVLRFLSPESRLGDETLPHCV